MSSESEHPAATSEPPSSEPPAPPPLTAQQESVVRAFGEHELPDLLGLGSKEIDFLLKKIHVSEEEIAGFFLNGLSNGGTFFHFYAQAASQILNSGYPDEAKEYFERFINCVSDIGIHLQYLNCCLLAPSSTNESMLAAAQEFSRRFDRCPAAAPSNTADPDKKLKIGFLCSFFDSSIMRDGILPTIRGRNRDACEVYCYSDGPIPQDFADAPDYWRNVAGMDGSALFDLIRQDEIDILRDLDGPTAENRLNLFLMRPAPIALHGANFKATSALSCYDNVFANEYSIPPEEEAFYTEDIVRGNAFYGASVNGFIGSDRFPAITPPPVLETGYVTFGYFGGAHKLNVPILNLWGRIAREITDARFVLKAGAFAVPRIRAAVLDLAVDCGLDRDQVALLEPTNFAEYIEGYSQIDIVPDVQPHSGGANILEALWMGKPVISIYGDRWAGRSGADFLRLMGQEDLIAYSEDEYVDLVVDLAKNRQKIKDLTFSLRQKFAESPLTDIDAYNRDLESAYREIWRKWCEGQTRTV